MQELMNYKLIRSKRKTIAIVIKANATVEIRAPLSVSNAEIDQFVLSKQNWINKNLITMLNRLECKAAFVLSYDSMLSVKGTKYPITTKDDGYVGFDGQSFCMPPGLMAEEIRDIAIQIYKIFAKSWLTYRVREYSKQMGVMPVAVKISSAKTRWGSCSAQNSINLSWRLIMADQDVIDYVVVHELAHIREHNHSKRFWAVVVAVLPDYKERQGKLREFGERIRCEGW